MPTPTKKAVHFGSGAIGRGFVGLFLHQAGYEVVFVDVSDTMVDLINTNKSYTVTEVGADGSRQVNVSNIRAINSKTDPEEVKKEIASADIVTCAVGVHILKWIAPLIAEGINNRNIEELGPLTVIACENAIGNTDQLRGHMEAVLSKVVRDSPDKYARFANCAVDRIVPAQEGTTGLDIRIEAFYEWVVELVPFKRDVTPPEIPAINYVPNLEPYITRKLYTVNTAHATAAYHGRLAGYKTIAKAMEDPQIRDITRGCITEAAKFIVDKFDISEKEQLEYVEKIISRISNPALEDPVDRVGRSPLRKLGRNDRLVGPAAALAERGWPHHHLLFTIKQAFQFVDVDGDTESHELARILSTQDAKQVVEKVCELKPADALYQSVVDVVVEVQQILGYRSESQPTASTAQNHVMAAI